MCQTAVCPAASAPRTAACLSSRREKSPGNMVGSGHTPHALPMVVPTVYTERGPSARSTCGMNGVTRAAVLNGPDIISRISVAATSPSPTGRTV
jgi:hypothetical protein